MSSSEQADDRCRALTEGGERCSRSAREDGFCHQHDESDPTVDGSEDGQRVVDENDENDRAADDNGDSEQMVDESEDDSDDNQQDDDESDESEQAVEAADDTSDGSHDDDRSRSAGGDIMAVRESVQAIGRDLIGHRIDGIIEVAPDGDGWRATVEVVERSSVPDTQDILGRYEIELDTDESVSGYRRVDRYRRADTDRDGPPD